MVRARLIKESARFYMSLSHDLSRHYNQICQHLVARFPKLKDAILLKGASINYTKLKKDLAQSVRNHKRCSMIKTSGKRAVIQNMKIIQERGDRVDDIFLPISLDELKRESKKSKPCKEHIQRLLTGMAHNYKDWINSDIRTLVDVLDQWPVLQCPEWIIYQAGLLVDVLTNFSDLLEGRLKLLFQSVGKVCGGRRSAADPTYEEHNIEANHFNILKYMEFCVNTKKNSSIFVVNEIGCEPYKPIANTPTLVIIKSAVTDIKISQAFLFVDKKHLCEIMEPTVIGLLKLWVCTHYCFNIHYGKGCAIMAQILEDCVLKELGTTSIQTLSSKAGPKSRKVLRANKIQTFYSLIKAEGFDI